MQKLEQKQRFLLKGLAEVCAELGELSDLDILEAWQRARYQRLHRVARALEHDCDQVADSLGGVQRFAWQGYVRQALACMTRKDVERFTREWQVLDPPRDEVVRWSAPPVEG